MPDPQELQDAFDLGRKAALDGEPISRNPFTTAQGSPTRALGFQWRKGHHVGEIDEAEGAGHFRDAK